MTNNLNNSPIALNTITSDDLIEPIDYTSPSIHSINAKKFNFDTVNKKSGKVSSKSVSIVILTTITLTIAATVLVKFFN